MSQEPEMMEDEAITTARQQGFCAAILAVICAAAVVGIMATAPTTSGYVPADVALFVVGATLAGIAVLAPLYALTRHPK